MDLFDNPPISMRMMITTNPQDLRIPNLSCHDGEDWVMVWYITLCMSIALEVCYCVYVYMFN